MQKNHAKLAFAYLAILAAAALYAGAGAWVKADFQAFVQRIESKNEQGEKKEVIYNGESFGSTEAARIALQESIVETIYPWIFRIPSPLDLLITVLSFGCLGGIAGLLKSIVLDKAEPTAALIVAFPFFGAIVGIMVLGMATLIPAALTVNETTLRPTMLLFLALFAGAFSEHAFKWLESNTKKIFEIK